MQSLHRRELLNLQVSAVTVASSSPCFLNQSICNRRRFSRIQKERDGWRLAEVLSTFRLAERRMPGTCFFQQTETVYFHRLLHCTSVCMCRMCACKHWIDEFSTQKMSTLSTFSNTLLKPSRMPNSFCCSTVLHFPACFLGLDSTYLQSQAAFGWQWHTIAYNGSGQSGALQEDARPLQSLCEPWKQSHNLWVRLRCCTWKTSSSLCAIKHVGQQMREA